MQWLLPSRCEALMWSARSRACQSCLFRLPVETVPRSSRNLRASPCAGMYFLYSDDDCDDDCYRSAVVAHLPPSLSMLVEWHEKEFKDPPVAARFPSQWRLYMEASDVACYHGV